MQTMPVDGLLPLFPAAMIADLQEEDEQSVQFLFFRASVSFSLRDTPCGPCSGCGPCKSGSKRRHNAMSGNVRCRCHVMPSDTPKFGQYTDDCWGSPSRGPFEYSF